jgi:hypothetical protein
LSEVLAKKVSDIESSTSIFPSATAGRRERRGSFWCYFLCNRKKEKRA